ncbi:hypothetical protein A3Q56_02045 [Intoshia linei]|uniref:Uncharacterized protein n=1 Tax=Intoshia linei TaxID=1819745 RepID=A0A177B7I8_9BILA|nr:hypothetical protein A3Q56_02045 [Intoshia linei]
MEEIYIRKMKVLKKPKFSLATLMDIHSDKYNPVETADDAMGRKVD